MFASARTVPYALVEAVAEVITQVLGASGKPALLFSAAGLLQVCTPLPDGTVVHSTLAAYLATFKLRLKVVAPFMVAAGFVVIEGSGPTNAFALPGTVTATVAATPSVDECDPVNLCSQICDRVATLAPIKLSKSGLDQHIIAPMAQLKEQDPSATLKGVLVTDLQKRFNIEGTLGLATAVLADSSVSQDAPVPPTSGSSVSQDETTPSPLKVVLDRLDIGPKGVLASTVGKLKEVKLLARNTSLKGLVDREPDYALRIAVQGSPGTATIFKVVSAA